MMVGDSVAFHYYTRSKLVCKVVSADYYVMADMVYQCGSLVPDHSPEMALAACLKIDAVPEFVFSVMF